METTGKFRRPWLGGVISGIGVSAILVAAIEQFSAYNLKNYTIVTVAAGLIAIGAGLFIACACRRCRDAADQA